MSMRDSKWFRQGFVWLIVVVIIVAAAMGILHGQGSGAKSRSLNSLLSQVSRDQAALNHWARSHDGSTDGIPGCQASPCVDRLSQTDNSNVNLTTYKGKMYVTTAPSTGTISSDFKTYGIKPQDSRTLNWQYQQSSSLGGYIQIAISIIPILIFGLLIFFMMRQAQGSNNQALSFGKSRARMFAGNRPTVTFADVAGVEEAKQELAEVVEFLKFPDKFAQLGARIPRGVLLVGPPGTGKTLLSRAVAGEAGVPFFSISGSEFVEMFVGVGASRVRDLFDQAKRNSPCIVFVDEIDAVGRQRGAGLGGSHDEREQTLNQILVEMDGFDTNANVIVIAATNRPDVLDPALLRPGRFDRQVVLDNPDIRGRLAILEVHARGKPFEKNVNNQTLAKQTPGFSGADLQNLLNEAAILAARRNKKAIGMKELEEAVDRVIAGPERKSRLISEKEKAITSYHEVGHALVARMLPNLDPVHKMTIVARGMAGGYTRLLPTEDRYLYSKSQFEETLAFSLGGHAAEQLIFGEVTTGASNDIERATDLARKMVTTYGMSDKLGPIALGKKEEMVFLGREIGEQRNFSEAIAEEIDSEVRRLINNAYSLAREILIKHKDKLITVSERLIREETIEGLAFDEIMGIAPPAIAASTITPDVARA
jgi:cell division protease FtsH